MNKRIKELRKALNNMTQQEFADTLGVKRNTVAQWEIGVNSLTDHVIKSICRAFNVNEDWLRHGTGEMFLPTPSDVLEELAAEYKLSHGAYLMVERFVQMDPGTQQRILDYFVDVAHALSENTEESATDEGNSSDHREDNPDGTKNS